MRTSFIFAYALAFCLLCLASCAKEQAEPSSSLDAEPVSRNLVSVRFTGNAEVPEEPEGSRVIISGGTGRQYGSWEVGDKVKIFYVDPSDGTIGSCIGEAESAGRSTTFNAEIPEGAERFWAVYPSTLTSSVDKDGHFSVTMPIASDVEATFSNACICIAQCGEDKIFHFRNLCAILQFTLEDKGQILQICSLGMEPIWGTINASLNENLQIVYDETTPYSGTDVTKQLHVAGARGTYYIPVLPLYTIGQRDVSGIAINHLSTYNAPAAFKGTPTRLVRSRITNLGTLDGKIVSDYFCTPDGAGSKNGKSWDNAMGVSELRTFLQCKTGDNLNTQRYLHIWKTKGTTLHLSQGTYVLGTAENNRLTVDFKGARGSVYSNITVKGGYPTGLTGTSTEGRNSHTYETVFSGAGSYGILSVLDRARITLDGITFYNAYNAAEVTSDKSIARGAALYIADSYSGNSSTNVSAELKAAPRVRLNDCVFRSNRTNQTDSDDNYRGGSAINITNGAVYANNCRFEDNIDYRTGCVCLSGGYEDEYLTSYAFFNACTFTGNRTCNYNSGVGSVVHHPRKGALLGIYNCTFYNNNQPVEGRRYGWNIINVNRSAIIANTTVVDNLYADGAEYTGYPIRISGQYNGANHVILVNNLLMNSAAGTLTDNRGSTVAELTGTAKAFLGGGNLFGRWNVGWGNATYVSKTVANEYRTGTGEDDGYLYSALDNPSWVTSALPYYFKWDGTLNSSAVTCNMMSLATMKTWLKSSDINQTDASTHIEFPTTTAGGDSKYAGFYYWLNTELGAISKDVTDASRPSTGWTPGSYQAN